MSGFLKFLLLLLILGSQANAQSKWSVDHQSSPSNGSFFIVSPPGSDEFYLLGYEQLKFSPSDQQLNTLYDLPPGIFTKEFLGTFSAPNRHLDVHFNTDREGLMVHQHQILKTADAGASWQVVLSLSPNNTYLVSAYFTAIDFPTENVGYAVGTNDKIFKSTDGGDTWQELSWSTSSAPYRRLSDVRFTDELQGFALGYKVDDILLNIGVFQPLIYRTVDGGQTWTETKFPETDHHFFKLYTPDSHTAYMTMVNRNFIVPQDLVFKSEDGGLQWEELPLPGATASSRLVIRDMHWFTATEGVILGSEEIFGRQNSVYRTTDGGATWLKTDLPQGIMPFFGKIPNLTMAFSGTHGLITGASGNLLKSEDRGLTWTQVKEGLPDIIDMAGHDDDLYALGSGDLLLRRTQGSWSRLSTPDNPEEYEKAFSRVASWGNDQVALIDVYNYLYFSTNRGTSWQTHFGAGFTRPYDVTFINGQMHIAARLGNENLVWMTYDENQREWSESFIVGETSISVQVQILQPEPGRLFLKVDDQLYTSTDQGSTWNLMNTLPANGRVRTFFTSASGHSVMQTSEGFQISEDYGQSWTAFSLGSENEGKLDQQISSLRGFGRFDNGHLFLLFHGTASENQRYQTLLFTSEDNGLNWELQTMPFTQEPPDHGMTGYLMLGNDLYVGAANGVVLQYERDVVTSLPGESPPLGLSVYPNPFSNTLNISGLKQEARFEIINSQGQIVHIGRILNESPTLTMPAETPSGLYFLKLYHGISNYLFKVFKE